MLKIAKERLNDLYAKINETMGLFIPVKKAGEVNYGKYEEGAIVSIDTLKTVKSAKDFFFPQTETLMAFKTEGKNIQITDTRSETEDFVVFGVRACDVKSIEVLDKVFLAEPVDTMYKNKNTALP